MGGDTNRARVSAASFPAAFPDWKDAVIISGVESPVTSGLLCQDLCEDPHLLVDGVSSHDFHQGKLGNCWFVAACSCLALRKSLWQQVGDR